MVNPELDASRVAAGSAQERLDLLVHAVYQRRVVPIIGSGVSANAVPASPKLISKLKDLLKQLDFLPRKGSKLSLPGLAEIAIRRHSHVRVCRVLGIAEWKDKRPAPAHRYLAMLAADGVIDEMITTNYDCCLENAWKALGRKDGLVVVSDAAELHQARPRWNDAHLVLFKINGCAKKLSKSTSPKNDPDPAEEEAARKILLTDTQLLGLERRDERRWVRDLLRDRTRSRTLLFSGFGSDEPQVWHVVRLILEELAALRSARKNGGNENGEKTPPRLWAALYDDVLPFYLLTTLADEAELRGRFPLKDGSNDGFDNIFSQADAALFGLAEGEKLDAGAFWRRIWLEVLRRSLRDDEGPVARCFVRASLGHTVPPPGPEVAGLLRLWSEVVGEAFESLPLDEPVDNDGKKLWEQPEPQASGAPGVAWAEDRYVTTAEEPEFWAAGVLLALHVREEGMDVGGELRRGVPVLVARYCRLHAWTSATAGQSCAQARVAGAACTKQVTLMIDAELLRAFQQARLRDLDDVKARVWDYLREGGALREARRAEQERRESRRKKA